MVSVYFRVHRGLGITSAVLDAANDKGPPNMTDHLGFEAPCAIV